MTVKDILTRLPSDAYIQLRRYSDVLYKEVVIDTRCTTAEELLQHSVFNDELVADIHIDYTDDDEIDTVIIKLV